MLDFGTRLPQGTVFSQFENIIIEQCLNANILNFPPEIHFIELIMHSFVSKEINLLHFILMSIALTYPDKMQNASRYKETYETGIETTELGNCISSICLVLLDIALLEGVKESNLMLVFLVGMKQAISRAKADDFFTLKKNIVSLFA